MNNIFIIICLFWLSFPVFSDTTPDGKTIVYCPKYIKCDVDRKLDSCHFSDNEHGLWRFGEYEGNITKGTYNLNTVFSTYERPQQGGGSCKYSCIDNKGIERVIISSFKNSFTDKYDYIPSHFGAYLGTSSQWNIVGWNAQCITSDPKLCPLVEYPGIYYKNLPGSSSTYFTIGTTKLPLLTYDKLLEICGATSVCKLGIAYHIASGDSLHDLGYVSADLTVPDKVTIVGLSSLRPNDYQFKKHEFFNTIYLQPTK